jgi:hypothetical protein
MIGASLGEIVGLSNNTTFITISSCLITQVKLSSNDEKLRSKINSQLYVLADCMYRSCTSGDSQTEETSG